MAPKMLINNTLITIGWLSVTTVALIAAAM